MNKQKYASLSQPVFFQFNVRALLAWETYVYIAKAREMDDKQKHFFTVNITLTKVPKE